MQKILLTLLSNCLLTYSIMCTEIQVQANTNTTIRLEVGTQISFITYYGGPYYPKNSWQLFKDFDQSIIGLMNVNTIQRILKSRFPEHWNNPYITKEYCFEAGQPGITHLVFVEKTKLEQNPCESLTTAIYTIEVH